MDAINTQTEKVLEILNLIHNKLDAFSFKLGSFKLSLMVIIKALVAYVILYWATKILIKFIDKRLKKIDKFSRSQKVLYIKIVKIVVITLAVLLGLNIIGIDLTTLAIVSSAVGFGVAFGLQKIFSNLISGIIILMDKSIQPGDVIAIGDTYGEVVNLEARYVSVITRDGKAHLIPNEILITEKVENWSYGDTMLRLKISVPVSYGSDLRFVEKLLLDAAKEHKRVISRPPPRVLLLEFGDSSINLELRAWIIDPMNGLRVPQSEILWTIWDKFKEHKIEVPFPQLEVKVK